MNKEIEQLEQSLVELKRQYEIKERLDYEKSPHKAFKEGDFVKKGDVIGIVGWVENKASNLPEHAGYMGVSLITGTRGFMAPARRDEWDLVDDRYYKNIYELKMELTGLEIEDLLYCIGPSNFNFNAAKSKLIDKLKSLKQNP